MQAIKHIIQKFYQLFYTFLSLLKKSSFWKSSFWRGFVRVEARLKARWGRLPRLRYMALAGVMLLSVCIPTITILLKNQSYHLSDEVRALVGEPNKALANKLTYNAAKDSWQFNKDGLPLETLASADADTPSLSQLKAQIGGAGEKQESLYAVDMPSDGRKGVTYYDTNTNLSFTLKPQFNVAQSRKTDAYIVYSADKDVQLVYSAKANGMKEDIILNAPVGDEVAYRYTLALSKDLEAKILDNGDIGIYGINPALYSAQTSTDADAEKLRTARETAPKDYLIFGLPAPVVIDSAGKHVPGSFSLDNGTLTVHARGLAQLAYPLTIDPSVVVTSSSDFQSNYSTDGMIDFDTADQVTRDSLTGGTTGSWSTTNSFTAALGSSPNAGRSNMGFTLYNGYMYIVGNYNGAAQSSSAYTSLNSNGTANSWVSTTSLPGVRMGHKIVAYNGYMYVLGGHNGAGTWYNDVLYAPINSDGSLGSWSSTTSFSGVRSAHGAVAVNGYMYIAGGEYRVSGTGYRQSDIQYAPIHADGSLGSWTATTSLPTGRGNMGVVAYNDSIYMIGGNGTSGAVYNQTLRANINADGSLGSLVTEANLPANRSPTNNSSFAYNGYLYMAGGLTGSGVMNDVLYAPIYADKSIGAWTSTTSFTAPARTWHGAAAYNGYMYIVGGDNAADSAFYSDVQYSKLDDPGTTTPYTTSGNTFAATRRGAATAAYNSYLYVIGGDNGTTANTVYYTQMNNDGTVGSWNTTTVLPAVRTYTGAVAYNGYMYVIGGCSATYTSCGSSGAQSTVYSAEINSNGTLGSWNTDTALGAARYGLAVVAYNGYVYALGGLNFIGSFNTSIYRQAIAANGRLNGTWVSTGTVLPASMAYMKAVAYGGKLYVVGGCTAGPTTCTTTRNNVHYASFNTDGTLSAFTASGTFTTARGDFGLTAVNNRLYLAGGRTNTTYYSDTQSAPINTDGSVGTWVTVSGATLATARYGIGMVSANGNLYVTGGHNGSSYYNHVQIARINNGGGGVTDSPTTDSTDPFTTARTEAQTVAYNGYLYVLGGRNGATYYNSVQYAKLNTDGSVGAWSAGTSFATGRAVFSATAINGYMYILGGWTGSADWQDIQYASINPNGSLGSWATAGSDVSNNGGQGACIAAHGNRIYSLGGWDGSTNHNSVLYATQNSNGTIGSWTATNSFATPRSNLNCVVNGDYLYISGGEGSQTYNDTQFAAINSDGTLGSWTPTTSFALARVGHAMVSYNGYMYIAGGINAVGGGTARSDVQYAPINANGTLGEWQHTTSVASGYMDAAVWNGFMYAPSQATGNSNTQYARLLSTERKGSYTKFFDIGMVGRLINISYNGNLPGGAVNLTYRTTETAGAYDNAVQNAQYPGFAEACHGVYGSARYVMITATLDDTRSATFGDAAQAYVTDLSLTYAPAHPDVNYRLNGGKTLIGGTLSPLDTCG